MASPAHALISSGLSFPLWLILWVFFPIIWLGILPINLIFLALYWPKRENNPSIFYGLVAFAVVGSFIALISMIANNF